VIISGLGETACKYEINNNKKKKKRNRCKIEWSPGVWRTKEVKIIISAAGQTSFACNVFAGFSK